MTEIIEKFMSAFEIMYKKKTTNNTNIEVVQSFAGVYDTMIEGEPRMSKPTSMDRQYRPHQ